MKLPEYDQALASVDLKTEYIKERIMPNSCIKEINTCIKDGFIFFIENPEYSQSGFSIVYNFKLTNFSFQGQH